MLYIYFEPYIILDFNVYSIPRFKITIQDIHNIRYRLNEDAH